MRYLLISFLRKPGGQIDEMVAVSKKIKDSDLQSCNIIMDFALRKIDKCVVEGKKHDTTYQKLRDYYVKVYPQLVDQLEREAPLSIPTKTKNIS